MLAPHLPVVSGVLLVAEGHLVGSRLNQRDPGAGPQRHGLRLTVELDGSRQGIRPRAPSSANHRLSSGPARAMLACPISRKEGATRWYGLDSWAPAGAPFASYSIWCR